MHILLADDDARLVRILKRGLESSGHVVDVAFDGEEALAAALAPGHDVLVLDVMMPGLDGFEVVRELRRHRAMTPALMLTARGEVEDRVRGLDAGADDYLTKPFDLDELLARLRALARRGAGATPVLSAGAVELDMARHEVRARGERVELSPTEFRLLEYLMRNADRVLTRPSILAHVWGYEDEPGSNAVDLYVHYLRRKLGAALRIETVRGMGYRVVSTG